VSMPIDAEADFAPDVTEHVDEVGPSQHDTECPPDQSHLQSVTVRRRSLRREILRSIDLDRNQNGSLPTMVVADSPKTRALDEPLTQPMRSFGRHRLASPAKPGPARRRDRGRGWHGGGPGLSAAQGGSSPRRQWPAAAHTTPVPLAQPPMPRNECRPVAGTLWPALRSPRMIRSHTTGQKSARN
jgi:hypothetical protein